jgi:ATP-dependent helicase/nuclease subunit A
MTSYLIEKDKQQRLQALDATQSFIVQAPAGSGKTELLIQRFLTLLTKVYSPEEILAITFTKKAANEMRSRIIKALKQAENEGEPESEHAKQTWHLARKVLQRDSEFNWHLTNNPNQLRILTIDALCAFLTKQLPLLSHFGSQPNIADNSDALYREAAQTILLQVEDNDEWAAAIAQLLLHLDNDFNKVHDLLVSLLKKRDQWLPYIHLNTSDENIHQELLQHIEFVIADHLKLLRSLFPADCMEETMSIAQFAASHISQNSPDDLKTWTTIGKILLTSSHTWRKRVDEKIGFPPLSQFKNPDEKAIHQAYRQRLAKLIETLSQHEALRLALAELFFLPTPHFQETQWTILQALLRVLKIASAQLRLTFQQQGVIDFIENAQAALVALGTEENPTDLTLSLDYCIQHILVDEFQDTSFTQYQLLEKLIQGWEKNDGRTLFVVGDPMQSIYRFREAEVGLFIRMREKGIGNVKLNPLRLALNFRSTPRIVEWNNQHFNAIFPSFTNMAVGAIHYSESVSPNRMATDDSHSFISINGIVEDDDQAQAVNIVKTIQETITAYPNEKIAILVRSRSHLSAIIPALKKANIAYRAVDIDPLSSRQCILDLLSLTCALLHPADRIAWLSILRSPICGLSLADLFIIAGDKPYLTIIEQLSHVDVISRLSKDGQQRIQRILPILKNKIAERERDNFRTWIEETWLLLGGPATLSNQTDFNDVEVFFQLLSSFNSQHAMNIDQLKEKMEDLKAATQHEDSNVQIMTIHTAKGLEFDTVILPHLERKMPYDSKPLLAWMERPLANENHDKVALLLAPIHATGAQTDSIYDYIIRQQKFKADYETDRLLYVATTRAKKRLHLYFNASRNESGEVKTLSGSFLEKLWPLIQHTQSFASATLPPVGREIQKRCIMRLPAAWTNPYVDSDSTLTTLHRQQEGFKLIDVKPKIIGIVIHRIMQQLAHLGIAWWKACDQRYYIQRQLNHHAMPTDIVAESILSIQETIDQVLSDKQGQWILHPHSEARSEYAISALIEGKVENLVMDRTFVDENNVRWIIDYKTASPLRRNVNEFLQEEKEKYGKQMQKYADAMKLMDNREIRLGLYFPVMQVLIRI